MLLLSKNTVILKSFQMYRIVTSARPCNKVCYLFSFTILAQHETDDVILYIHSVHTVLHTGGILLNFKITR